MSTNDNLFKWQFEKELIKLALGCTGLAKSTARRKAKRLWQKYHVIVSYSEVEQIRIDKELTENREAMRVLREGRIVWGSDDSKRKAGAIDLKQIEQIEIFENRTVLITLSGREIGLNKDFGYLRLVFNI